MTTTKTLIEVELKENGLTQEYLKHRLEYNPDTGIFTWHQREAGTGKFNTYFAGKKAGKFDRKGYVLICLDYKHYRAHRLAFLYMTGKMPPDSTDHINGDKSDNRWENLRAVNHAENSRNVSRRSINKSGIVGVAWRADTLRWNAGINGSPRINLGCFDNLLDACAARKSAEIYYGYHVNHGRSKPVGEK